MAVAGSRPTSAGLAAARLGVPHHRIRIYYSAQHPAVLRTPIAPPALFRRGEIGPFANAIADIIEAMCDRVIEKGKLAFATIGSIARDDVGFDALAGRFFVMDSSRSRSLAELVAAQYAPARTGHCNE